MYYSILYFELMKLCVVPWTHFVVVVCSSLVDSLVIRLCWLIALRHNLWDSLSSLASVMLCSPIFCYLCDIFSSSFLESSFTTHPVNVYFPSVLTSTLLICHSLYVFGQTFTDPWLRLFPETLYIAKDHTFITKWLLDVSTQISGS